MIKLNKLEDLKPYYVEEINTYVFNDHIKITFNLYIRANIDAWNINARDINAYNIDAWNINAGHINANDIKARHINTHDINANDIKAWDINANDIKADSISYFAICSAYNNIECSSIKGRRNNAKHFVLDGEIIIKPKEQKKSITLEITDEQIEKVKKPLEVK